MKTEAALPLPLLTASDVKVFLFATAPGLMQWVPGAVSSGVKRLEREVDHSPPPIVEVKNGGAIPPLPPHVLMA
jgi:hypothetical protein